MRIFYSLLFVLVSFLLQSQTLYWVGGSGNFNDGLHWSLTSGGNPSGIIPNASSHLIFDDNSTVNKAFIELTQSVDINSIDVLLEDRFIELQGLLISTIKINGSVQLNPNFKFNVKGKVLLSPLQDAVYQFSHTLFTNEIEVITTQKISLGVINCANTVKFNGTIQLKNSIIIAQNIHTGNANLTLEHTTLFAKNQLIIGSSGINGVLNTGNKLIAPQTGLTNSQINILSNSSSYSFKTPIPAACTPSLIGFSNPTCKGLCNGTATISLANCTAFPATIQWINTNATGDPFCAQLPLPQSNYSSTIYTVNTLCRCSDQYVVLVTDNTGAQGVVNLSITDPPPTIFSFSSTSPTCNGFCNGQIRANVISGNIPLSVNWNPPVVTHTNVTSKDTLKNACASTYSITAINKNGCIDNFTLNLTQPMVLLVNGLSSSVTCGAPVIYVWACPSCWRYCRASITTTSASYTRT